MPPRGKLPRGITMHGELFRCRVAYHGRQYQVGEFFTLSDARAALAIARAQMARDMFVPVPERHRQWNAERASDKAETLTVRTWSHKWLDSLEKSGRSPSTVTSYRSTLRVHVLPMLGEMRLVDVKPIHVEAILTDKSDSVKFNISRCLSSMFRAAIKAKQGGLTASPISSATGGVAKRLRRPEGADDASPAEVWAIADAMPKRLVLAVKLTTLCALRLGETLGLQRRDVDLRDPDDPVLHIARQWLTKQTTHPDYAPPKVGSTGTVAIPTCLLPQLRTHLEKYVAADAEAALFPPAYATNRPVSQSTLDRAWRTARDPIAPQLHMHSLRHIGLTAYNRAGATPAETLRRGRQGGSDTSIYGRYQNASRARDREITDIMGTQWEKELDNG